MRRRNEKADQEFQLRIGISVGEPVTKAGELFGAAVQLGARRVRSPRPTASPSRMRSVTLVGKRIEFDSKARHELKGFPEPVPVYEVLFASA